MMHVELPTNSFIMSVKKRQILPPLSVYGSFWGSVEREKEEKRKRRN